MSLDPPLPRSFFIGATAFLSFITLGALIQSGVSIVSVKRSPPPSRLPFIFLAIFTPLFALGYGFLIFDWTLWLGASYNWNFNPLNITGEFAFAIADGLLLACISWLILERWELAYDRRLLPMIVLYGLIIVQFTIRVLSLGIGAYAQVHLKASPDLRDASRGLHRTWVGLELIPVFTIFTYAIMLKLKLAKKTNGVLEVLTIVSGLLLLRSLQQLMFVILNATWLRHTPPGEVIRRTLQVGLASTIVQGTLDQVITWLLIFLPIRYGRIWFSVGIASGDKEGVSSTSSLITERERA